MNVVSPYGKDVKAELNQVYNLASVSELVARVRVFLTDHYGFEDVRIKQVHVAFGITVNFSHANEDYYLKFTDRANHRQPEALFCFLEYLRAHQLPVPEIIKTLDHTYFENILKGSPYDVTYVMRALDGQVLTRPTAKHLEKCVEVIAAFHRIGATYKPVVHASYRNFHDYFREAMESFEPLVNTPARCRGLLESTATYTRYVFKEIQMSNKLSKTHIHGDFRFCHILFDARSVSGVFDAEHATYAERLHDVCTALVSHSSPARCLLLDLNEILTCLKKYDALYPFNQADRQALKAMLSSALLNELSGMLLFLGTGQSESRSGDVRKLWDMLEDLKRMPDDLALSLKA